MHPQQHEDWMLLNQLNKPHSSHQEDILVHTWDKLQTPQSTIRSQDSGLFHQYTQNIQSSHSLLQNLLDIPSHRSHNRHHLCIQTNDKDSYWHIFLGLALSLSLDSHHNKLYKRSLGHLNSFNMYNHLQIDHRNKVLIKCRIHHKLQQNDYHLKWLYSPHLLNNT